MYKSKPAPVKVTSSNVNSSKKPTISGIGEKGCKVTIQNKNKETIETDIVDDNGKWSIVPNSEL